ncbi:hypothetical protein F53441_14297 [Fusarium austroafricanum]|uniref:Uncharacterized protein n=1 Tax=Fusarium austroafricanum TaxID=2364996 RepID=A0A8H4NFF2_9HYPO|nr:hypothetical protein F53441_14297 [Fusarium austroafricanum]
MLQKQMGEYSTSGQWKGVSMTRTSTKLTSKLGINANVDEDPSFGFWIEFPLATKDYEVAMKTAAEVLEHIPQCADILCATITASHNDGRVHEFKLHADGFAIDEAANMTQADLLRVWGNTPMPCFLFGDAKRLPSAVMIITEKWPASEDYGSSLENRSERS